MTARKTNKNSHRYASNDNHSATRKYIISTAYDLFREKGYAKASMSELARRINMDPSSLYYYFPSKEALLAELCIPQLILRRLINFALTPIAIQWLCMR